MSETKDNKDNPYANRNHDSGGDMGRDDIYAVAGLLGQVSSSLNAIDQQNVGGVNQFIQAKKLDPKQVLKGMVAPTTGQPLPPQQPVQVEQIPAPMSSEPIQQPTQQPIQQPIIQTDNSLEKRVIQLEKVIESYKKIVKFKRGISYTINTAKITGEFKNPIDIIDIITSELSKQTKSITLKLNDNTKN